MTDTRFKGQSNADCSGVVVTIPGRAFDVAAEGNWPIDCPRGWQALSCGERRRVGRGSQVTATLQAEDALDLANYLASVAALWREMTAEERDGDDPRPLERAALSIHGDPRFQR